MHWDDNTFISIIASWSWLDSFIQFFMDSFLWFPWVMRKKELWNSFWSFFCSSDAKNFSSDLLGAKHSLIQWSRSSPDAYRSVRSCLWSCSSMLQLDYKFLNTTSPLPKQTDTQLDLMTFILDLWHCWKSPVTSLGSIKLVCTWKEWPLMMCVIK